VIKSRERMTYTSVKRILVDREPEMLVRYREIVPKFELMEECHRRIRANRVQRGSIDFDLPEPEIIMDMQGDVADIVRAERHVAHMMIEDFMIAANEAVAEFLTARKAGCVYRVHETPPPDKLREFGVLLHNLGYKFHISKEMKPGALAEIVKAVSGKPEERLVNHQMLRSMSQAVYGAENKGHFGLASRCYCHFTSPIRRYPDLVVHRLLAGVLSGNRLGAPKERLEEIGRHASRRERVAMEAEREMAKLYAAMFMAGKVGEEFDGIISHVTKFGFFVELIDFFVEGVVRLESLTGDRYRMSPDGMSIIGKKKKSFKIGDTVRIAVEEVDVPMREIVFALVCP
jgi:ribonuclease R